MLSELGASPSSNSGLVSSSTEPHLKLVIASVHLCNERRNGSERGLAQCTATWVAGALRQPQGALTSARADALYRKSANRTDFTRTGSIFCRQQLYVIPGYDVIR